MPNSRQLQRHSKNRSERKRVFVLCDGEKTEYAYFNALKSYDPVARNFTLTVRSLGTGTSRIDAIANAGKGDREYEHVACVFDTEIPADRNAILAAEKAAKDAANASVYWSNPCFEVWILAHFVKRGSLYASPDAVISDIHPHWQSRFLTRYRKNDERNLRQLPVLTETAISNCAWVEQHHHPDPSDICECNSYSQVHKLVEYLMGQKSFPVTG